MATVEKTTSGKVILTCDCEAVHTITKKEDGELELKSKFIKKVVPVTTETKKGEDDGVHKETKKFEFPDIFD